MSNDEEKEKNNKKEKKEMENLIRNWMTSKKYSEIRKELDKKREELKNIMNLDKNKVLLYFKDNGLNKEEIIKMANDIIEYDSLSEEDKAEFIWITDNIYSIKTKDEIYFDFLRAIITWYTYILIYQKIEDYETCALLKKVVEIEKREVIRNISNYFTFESEDEELIKQIEEEVIKKMLL